MLTIFCSRLRTGRFDVVGPGYLVAYIRLRYGAAAGVGGSVGDDVPGGVAGAGRRRVAHVVHVLRPVDHLPAAARRHRPGVRGRRAPPVAAPPARQCRHGARPPPAAVQEAGTCYVQLTTSAQESLFIAGQSSTLDHGFLYNSTLLLYRTPWLDGPVCGHGCKTGWNYAGGTQRRTQKASCFIGGEELGLKNEFFA